MHARKSADTDVPRAPCGTSVSMCWRSEPVSGFCSVLFVIFLLALTARLSWLSVVSYAQCIIVSCRLRLASIISFYRYIIPEWHNTGILKNNDVLLTERIYAGFSLLSFYIHYFRFRNVFPVNVMNGKFGKFAIIKISITALICNYLHEGCWLLLAGKSEIIIFFSRLSP